MKAGATVSTLTLLTLISTGGVGGCSKQETATTTTSGKGAEHAQHAEATRDGLHGEEHGAHGHHGKDGHNRSRHGEHHGKESAPQGGIKVGDVVPDFSLRTLDGKSVKLSELQKAETRTKKGIVVLSFWCMTCHSCRHVEHQLAKLSKDYEGQAAVVALDANADETAEGVAAFVRKKGLELPILLDPSGNTADVLGVNKTTTTMVIDGHGVLRYCGQFRQKGDGGSAEEALQAVLAGTEVAVKTTPHTG